MSQFEYKQRNIYKLFKFFIPGEFEGLNYEELYTLQDFWDGYMDIGAPDKVCAKCEAVIWMKK